MPTIKAKEKGRRERRACKTTCEGSRCHVLGMVSSQINLESGRELQEVSAKCWDQLMEGLRMTS